MHLFSHGFYGSGIRPAEPKPLRSVLQACNQGLGRTGFLSRAHDIFLSSRVC